MSYSVFLIHNSADDKLINYIASNLKKNNIKSILANKYFPITPNENLSNKIAKLIDISDCALILLTRNSIKSPWVNYEIGYAYKKSLLYQ